MPYNLLTKMRSIVYVDTGKNWIALKWRS